MKIIMATASLLLAGPVHAMTVLNFDGDICSAAIDGSGAKIACINGRHINQSYGDGDGVNLSYFDKTVSSTSMSFWGDSYSGMSNVAYGGVDPYIKIEGAVTLHSFDLGAWPNADRMTQVRVIDLANMFTVLNLEGITVLGSTPSHFEINASSTAGFLIGFGPDGFNVGIDNIAFTAGVVPEPANWALLVAGLGLLGTLTRRRLR